MSKQLNWKGKYTQKILTQRSMPRVTGVTQPTYGEYLGMFTIFVGVCIGVFLTIIVLRPDLINRDVFMRSFMIGVMIGRH